MSVRRRLVVSVVVVALRSRCVVVVVVMRSRLVVAFVEYIDGSEGYGRVVAESSSGIGCSDGVIVLQS